MSEQSVNAFKQQIAVQLSATTEEQAEIINNMVDGGAAGALPAVSSTDNGKVLTVANGAWVAGAASGGGEALIITIDTSGDQPKFNTKAGVVWEAISNGANVYVDMNGLLCPILTAGYWEDDGYEFDMVYWQTTTLKKAMYLANTADDYPEIPMT